ncbi:MAG: hypothetical protein L3K26_15285, partial [Candidatus Hydrogenedentes bacterium]|nr:hypothetical protein [Candidatus Hydrogenedentota bacterium]
PAPNFSSFVVKYFFFASLRLCVPNKIKDRTQRRKDAKTQRLYFDREWLCKGHWNGLKAGSSDLSVLFVSSKATRVACVNFLNGLVALLPCKSLAILLRPEGAMQESPGQRPGNAGQNSNAP